MSPSALQPFSPSALSPHSLESEEHLLSELMLDDTGEAWSIAQQCGVKPAAFYDPANKIIYDAIAALHQKGSPATPDTVIAELQLRAQFDDIGGYPRMTRVTAHAATIMHARTHAETIVLFWQLRHTALLAADLARAASTFTTRDDFTETLGSIGQRLIRFGRLAAPRTIAEQVATVATDVLARAAGTQDKTAWVHTGLPQFDRTLLPFGSAREDHFIIAAGGSGHGKSALMRQIAGAALLAGQRVLVYTRETSIEGFIEQLTATWSRIDLRKIDREPRDKLETFAKKCSWLENEIADRRLWIAQHEPATPLLTIEDLATHYRAFSHLHGHPDLTIVDYAQLFLTRKRCSSREQEVATISHTLQSLCRESAKVWLVGAQYNESGLREMRTPRRDSEGRLIHRMPTAGDLRESQSLYHDADRVICIYRPPEDRNKNDQTGPTAGDYPEQWLVQIKRRKGGLGYIRCVFEAPHTRFTEIAREGAPLGPAPAPAPVPPGGMTKADFKKNLKT